MFCSPCTQTPMLKNILKKASERSPSLVGEKVGQFSLLPSAPPCLLPCLSPRVTLGGICRFVCCHHFRREAQGLSGQCWVWGSISSTDSPGKCIWMTEECKVGPASTLIKKCFEKYFMTVSGTYFYNVDGRSSVLF